MKKAILKTSGTLLVVGLAFTAMLFGCKHKTAPKTGAEQQTEKVTITVDGDANVTVNAPASFEVAKGSKWSTVKANVEGKVTYKEGYAAAGFKLENASGQDLTDDYVFNINIAVFAVSKAKGTQQTESVDPAIFTTNGNGKITGYNCSKEELPKNLVIPAKIGNEVITSIGLNVFYSCSGLTSVSLPASLTSIGSNSFRECSGLTSVSLSSCTSLTSIGETAFGGCSGLTSVSLPTSLTSIGERAFSGCSGLTSVSLSSCTSLTSIGESAFSVCSSLTSVDLSGCTSLTLIGEQAFYGCKGLTSVDLSSCTSLTSIGGSAFSDCTGLTSVSFPASLTSIGERAFSDCDNLTSAIFADAAGWAVYGGQYGGKAADIQQSDLANAATAAKYLRDNYSNKYWKKN